MNRFTVKNKKLNKGKETTIATPLGKDEFINQFTEIFQEEHYKDGLRKKDMVVIDVGGNMGLSALYFAPYAKMIYVIEPSTQHYLALVENTKDYSNIKPIKAAISAV